MSEDKQQYQTVLLLGNGFDLHYKLLTRYQDFLKITEFLIEQKKKKRLCNFKTYADLLGCTALKDRDDATKANWCQYEGIYKTLSLSMGEIEKLADEATKNPWFRYLLKSFNRNAGWIDFENEIGSVLHYFNRFFENINRDDFSWKKLYPHKGYRYLFEEAFNFWGIRRAKLWRVFHRKWNAGMIAISREFGKEPTRYQWLRCYARPEFTSEHPGGSGNSMLDKEKVIDELFAKLQEVADVLKSYLDIFVERVFREWQQSRALNEKKPPIIRMLSKIENVGSLQPVVVTFNYTRTFEYLNGEPFAENSRVLHVHGEISQRDVVLGIGSDKSDCYDTLNTDFLKFKKYFQRVFYETDLPYLKAVEELKDFKANSDGKLWLVVMGHSLDITDRDVIEELEKLADRITILYHRKSAVASYISNLVKIFGKEKFDVIRTKKKLSFESIEDAKTYNQAEYEIDLPPTPTPV